MDQNICKICFENEINTINIPCNHTISCDKCIQINMPQKCGYCNQPIEKIRKLGDEIKKETIINQVTIIHMNKKKQIIYFKRTCSENYKCLTILELKKYIEYNNIGYELEHIVLHYQDKILENDKTMDYYHIQNDSEIQLDINVPYIYIQYPQFKVIFLLPLSYDNKITTRISYLYENHLYPTANGKFKFNEKILNPDKTLDNYNINKADTIYYECIGEHPKIFIKTLTGKTVTIILFQGLDINVDVLGSYILNIEGIPINQQRIIFAGRQLEFYGGKELSYYKICEHSTLHMVLNLRGGKPVINLYSNIERSVNVKLELCDKFNFSAIHPMSFSHNYNENNMEWKNVTIKKDRITYENNDYSYLFWEAVTKEMLFDMPDNKFCISTELKELYKFLNIILKRLGLNFREIQDMITYWIKDIIEHKYVVLSFLPLNIYEKIAKLTITPEPKQIIRVFMVFYGSEQYVQYNSKIEDINQIDRNDEFLVVEWGGMGI